MKAMPKLHRIDRGVRILVVSGTDNPELSGACAEQGRAVTMIYVPDLAEARHAVATESIDAILIDFDTVRASDHDIRRHLGASSRRIPVFVLLEDNAIVQIDQAIALAADGFYYKRQLYQWLFGGHEARLSLDDAAD